ALEVFGDGTQLRDPVYVDDVVDAFLLAGGAPRLPAREYNIGGPHTLNLREIAGQLAPGRIGLCDFPAEHKAFDIGSYAADWRRIHTDFGWRPSVAFDEGCRRTLDYFRESE